MITGKPETVIVREVGPRDGLQAELPLDVATRTTLIELLINAGITDIEIAAFMREDRVPSMAGAEAVVSGTPPRAGLNRHGLVANLKGAERAVAAGIRHLTVTISLSEQYSKKNVGMSCSDSLAQATEIASLATQQQCSTDLIISCSFGSPFHDVNTTDDLPPFFAKARAAGVSQVTLADTTGVASPSLLRAIVGQLGTDFGLHLHDNRGTAIVTAFSALELGVRRFDTSIGGIGGSPFAPGAMGNLATESLIHLLDDLGFTTGISLARLFDAGNYLQQILCRPLPSRLFQAGPN